MQKVDIHPLFTQLASIWPGAFGASQAEMGDDAKKTWEDVDRWLAVVTDVDTRPNQTNPDQAKADIKP